MPTVVPARPSAPLRRRDVTAFRKDERGEVTVEPMILTAVLLACASIVVVIVFPTLIRLLGRF